MNLELDGIAPLINRLEKFDKDVSKELKKEMRGAANKLVKDARGVYPSTGLTNWGPWMSVERGRDLSYVAATARKSVKLQTTRKRLRSATVAFGYSAVQRNPGAALLETAGNREPNSPFNLAIQQRHGPPTGVPRYITRAYYSIAPQVRAEIEGFVQKAMRKVGL